MADAQRDRSLTETGLARERGPTGHTTESEGRSALAIASVVTGGLGAVIALIPAFWTVALPLAAVALVAGLLVVRDGPSTPGYRTARIGVGLGIAAAVLGVLNLAISADVVDYFTTD